MIALRYSAYALFAVAALVAVVALANEAFMMLGGTIWAGIMGLLLLAADRALTYLREIRDSMTVAPVQPVDHSEDTSAAHPDTPAPTLEGLDAKMEKFRQRREGA